MSNATLTPPTARRAAVERKPIAQALTRGSQFHVGPVKGDDLIRFFFAGNAVIAIVVLALITLSLFLEAWRYIPLNDEKLLRYRNTGQQLVDLMDRDAERHTQVNRDLISLKVRLAERLRIKGETPEQIAAALVPLDDFANRFDDTVTDVRGVISDTREVVRDIRDRALIIDNNKREKQMLLDHGKVEEANAITTVPLDFPKELAPVLAAVPTFVEADKAWVGKLTEVLKNVPKMPDSATQNGLNFIVKDIEALRAKLPATDTAVAAWTSAAPIGSAQSIWDFLFGAKWQTNSAWVDNFGVLPLLTGSLLVAVVAMTLAVPLGIGSAVYINQLASPWEQHFIKPAIEFISAIPSVVLGFFGVAVLGDFIKWMSEWVGLSWVPFFPLEQRLNAFTAGCLLALMAVPTIFTLAEDAINNVPRAFKEASYALGATRMQTIWRVILPSSLSGICSAVLLGLGRVIGETMVVLLCAGNALQIPGFGPGMFFQPVHTMVGIIAQEMGEVEKGSLWWSALFTVGLLLFMISLVINWVAQAIVRRYRVVGA